MSGDATTYDSPSSLLDAARMVLASGDRRLGADRVVAASLLARQALESALRSLWADVAPAMAELSGRAQLITLPFVLGDREMARSVTYAWYRLSAICHHHAYELPPTPDELDHLLGIVEQLAASREG